MARLGVKIGFVFMTLLVIGALPTSASAGDESYKKSQFYRGITALHVVSQVLQSDVDGDGVDEVLVCYRESEEATGQQGGVLILSGSGRNFQVAWHAMFEKAYPDKVTAAGKALTFSLVRRAEEGQKSFNKTFVLGKDFFFRQDAGSPLAGVKATASSTLKGGDASPDKVFDQDLKTGWAEGRDGTGVDETLSLEFAKPVGLALIGVLHGNFRGKRQWQDNNRLHRAEVTVETGSDRYDTASDVDFGQDLGLGLYGDRLELSFSNRPVMRYFKLQRNDVLSLELKITSVLLGEKNDDTYVSEIDLVELIPSWVLEGKKKPELKKDDSKKKEDEPEGDDWTEDDF